jgi:large subunit ribosomal protein L54
MTGLNYFKNKPDVFAKEDSEYPDWLWGLLGDATKDAKTQKGGVDPSSMFSGLLIIGDYR